jgi:pantoate--beta-alanine ligase
MKVLSSRAELARWRAEGALGELGSIGSDLGLVPTMGALHEGHLSLVRRSVRENGRTLATVFVNPAQFEDAGDLEAYPRDLDRDVELLAGAGCDALFAPPAELIYPPGYQTWVEVGEVAQPLEGAARPGHFRGVATVVLKLVVLTAPRRAYFGEKDAQQLAVVRQLARDLELPVEIVGCATVREPDGLAMSSRNARLPPAHRRSAATLYQALRAAEERWLSGERDSEGLRRAMHERLGREEGAVIDYVSVADPVSLRELDRLDTATPPLLSLAVRFGPVRLIDNLALRPTGGRGRDRRDEDPEGARC